LHIGAYAHIAPGAVLGGNVRVDEGVLLGLGSRVLPGCHVATNAIVGAGSVVIHDVPCGVTVMGIPAR